MNDDDLRQLLERAASAVAGLPEELRPAALPEAVRLLSPSGGSEAQGASVAKPRKTRKGTRAKASQRKTGKARISRGSLSLDRDLDLRPTGKPSLKDFHDEKAPRNQAERNAVFVYYLERVAQVGAVTVDQVYTAYKELNIKVPSQLRNSLAQAASKKGWIDSADMDALKVTTRGENLVDHDLPRKTKEK